MIHWKIIIVRNLRWIRDHISQSKLCFFFVNQFIQILKIPKHNWRWNQPYWNIDYFERILGTWSSFDSLVIAKSSLPANIKTKIYVFRWFFRENRSLWFYLPAASRQLDADHRLYYCSASNIHWKPMDSTSQLCPYPEWRILATFFKMFNLKIYKNQKIIQTN